MSASGYSSGFHPHNEFWFHLCCNCKFHHFWNPPAQKKILLIPRKRKISFQAAWTPDDFIVCPLPNLLFPGLGSEGGVQLNTAVNPCICSSTRQPESKLRAIKMPKGQQVYKAWNSISSPCFSCPSKYSEMWPEGLASVFNTIKHRLVRSTSRNAVSNRKRESYNNGKDSAVCDKNYILDKNTASSKFIHVLCLSTMFRYLYFTFSKKYFQLLLLHCISEENIVHFTPLHLFNSYGYWLLRY